MTEQALRQQDITAFLVSESRRIDPAHLPPDVLEMARHCVLDWLGVTIAGAGEPLVLKLIEEAREQGGNPDCTLVWHGDRVSSAFAALINGSAADALDFSDTNFAMHGHSTPAVVATAFALAEARGASGLEFLAAIVAGIELECRVGLLIIPRHLHKGFHPTGAIAPFGATAAAAHLLGLSDARVAHALGIAATQAAGLLASGGTMCKPFHSGKAAMNGLLAAKLAGRDFIARPDAIEAPEGFLATHASGMDTDSLSASRGRGLIMDTVFKIHASCGLTHSSIENLLQLKRDHRFAPGDVRRVDLQVPAFCLGVCNIQEPVTDLQAKFSLRATAAMALLGDDTTDIAAYARQRITRPEAIQLRDRVQVQGREDLAGLTSVASIELADGRRLTVSNDVCRPCGDLALQGDVLTKKFQSLAGPVIGEASAEEVRRLVLSADRLESVRPLLEAAVSKH